MSCTTATIYILHFTMQILCLPCYSTHLDQHSFPTRRSSDLNLFPDGKFGASNLRRQRGNRAARVGMIAVDRKSTRLNSSHPSSSYAVFCLKKKSTLLSAWLVSVRSSDRWWQGWTSWAESVVT